MSTYNTSKNDTVTNNGYKNDESETSEAFVFEGFEPANTTPVPDVLFDMLLTELSGSQLKVMLYIIRRTLGFKKQEDAISLNQLHKGIITKDKKQLDKGCGVKDKQMIVEALARLEDMNCIESVKGVTANRDCATTIYKIHFRGQGVVGKTNYPQEKGSGKNQLPVVGKTNYGSGKNQLGVVGKSDPQETVIQLDSNQETVIQEDTYMDVDAIAQHPTLSLSPQEMIAALSQIGYTISLPSNPQQQEIAANDTESHSQPHQGSEQTPPTPVASGNHAPPPSVVANTPRWLGDITDHVGNAPKQSHHVGTQDTSFLPAHPTKNSPTMPSPNNEPPTPTQGTLASSQREIELSSSNGTSDQASYSPTQQHATQTPLASSPDSAASGGSDEPAQPEKPQRPATPEMPPPEMKWNAEKLVQITECKRIVRGKVGAYFDESIRGNGEKAKSQRQRQLEAAKRILAKGVTEEEYVKAYNERNDEWWNQTQGSLTVEEMAANTKNKVMRILEILEKLDSMSKTIGLKQAGQGQKWGQTQQQQRAERAAQETAHSALMNGGLTTREINKLLPAEKKAYLDNLKRQNEQKNVAAAK